jgi:hypothetical protein
MDSEVVRFNLHLMCGHPSDGQIRMVRSELLNHRYQFASGRALMKENSFLGAGAFRCGLAFISEANATECERTHKAGRGAVSWGCDTAQRLRD